MQFSLRQHGFLIGKLTAQSIYAIERWLHLVHLTYSVHLSYLGKWPKPENQQLVFVSQTAVNHLAKVISTRKNKSDCVFIADKYITVSISIIFIHR